MLVLRHDMSVLLPSHATLHCYSEEWAGASSSSAIWCYPPPPLCSPPSPGCHGYLLLCWPMDGCCCMGPRASESEWLALINWADCFVEFIKDFLFPFSFIIIFFYLCLLRNDNQIGMMDMVCALAKLTANWKIFDKSPAWSCLVCFVPALSSFCCSLFMVEPAGFIILCWPASQCFVHVIL